MSIFHIRTLRKAIACTLLLSFPVYSNGNSMEDVFNAINANGHVSGPAVLQGQTMNAYTGGSLFMRAPSRTYQLATVTAPSWGAGCGGIDLYMGGFSHINKDQFVAMLKNIGSNAVGYAFKLAMQNLCPSCDNIMTALQTTANGINRLNIDSCEAAKGLVQATVPETWLKNEKQAAINAGTFSGVYSDITDAWRNVSDNWGKARDTNNAAIAAKPELKESVARGNVVWRALKKANVKHGFGATDDDLMLWMSLVGTVIFDTTGLTPSAPRVIPKSQLTLKDLVGADYSTVTGLTLLDHEVLVYECTDGVGEDQCLKPTMKSKSVRSFKGLVSKKILSITDAISSRSNHANSADMIRFVNATEFPVYKMIAVATSLNNTGMADALLGRYQDLIAAKYAEVWLSSAVRDLRSSLNEYATTASSEQSEAIKQIKPELDAVMADARNTMAAAYQSATTTMNVAMELQHIERSLSASVSPMLKNSLAFGRGLK
jgi:conjugative transfer pilus assembly protein TraH